MKKKVKDITIAEVNEACRKADSMCGKCPLSKACDIIFTTGNAEIEEDEIELPDDCWRKPSKAAKRKRKLSAQLISLAVQIIVSIATSFLYAAVAQNVWGWFIVPISSTLQPLSYPLAYGLMMGISVLHALIFAPTSFNEDPFQAEHPIAFAIIKEIAKAIAVLMLWGIAAIVHVAIGG